MAARLRELDAAGNRVRLVDDFSGGPAVVLGEYSFTLHSREEVEAVADAIVRLADQAWPKSAHTKKGPET